MIIELKNIDKEKVTLYIERTHGKKNSILIETQVYDTSLSLNQKITQAWEQVKSDILLMFFRVWDAKETAELIVFDDIPVFGDIVIDEEGNELGAPIIWAERLDRTGTNEDLYSSSCSPYDEPIVTIGFELEALPIPEPIALPRSEYEKMCDMTLYFMGFKASEVV